MNTIIWASANEKYRIVKVSPTFYLFYIDNYEISIWMEDGEFISSALFLFDIPKYVRKALTKHIGDII